MNTNKNRWVEVEEMQGLTLTKVIVSEDKEEVRFETLCGRVFHLFHMQDCCESVSVEDITGDLEDLIGLPLLMVEESTSPDEEALESGTWTFYKFATVKGYVTLRWLGRSNGYYSEGVSFEELLS
jgi:hypothetical protein